ncbi:MAG TPA: hypothetical protein VFI60_05710 [Candidatus Acidoferrum sp.]|nr:hypothetical protein [Candidatus Acidoferrum sp.]
MSDGPWALYQNSTPPATQPPQAGPWLDYASTTPPATQAAQPSVSDQGYTPTAFKASDLMPDWMTPVKFVKGVGEGAYGIGAGVLNSFLHPINAFEGAGQQLSNIKRDIEGRQYLGALADTLGLVGLDEKKAAQMWSQGQGAEAAGQTTTQGLAAYYGGKKLVKDIPETISKIKTAALNAPRIVRSLATPAGRQALIDSASSVRDVQAARTQQLLRASGDAAESHASRLVNDINQADEADLAEHGERAGISTRPFMKGMQEAQDLYRQSGQDMPGADAVASRIDQWAGTHITFEQAKQLRTYVGGILDRATGAQRAVLSATYGDLTDALRTRAIELDRGEQFAAYNKIHSVLQDYQRKGLFGRLLDAKDSGDFYKQVSHRGNQGAILRLQNTLKDYGLQPDALRKSFDDIKSLHQFLENSSGNSFIGIFRKLNQHPIGGGLGFAVGSLTGNYLSRIFGTWAGSALAERIAVLRALDKLGIPAEAGTASDIGKAANVMPKGASIGEQMSAKGQAPLEPENFEPSGGTPNEPVNLTPNGSGESGASLEAINRTASEKAAGQRYVSVDTRSGKETPIIGTDALDRASNPQPFERTFKVGPNGREQVAEGTQAKAARELQQTEQQVREVLNKAKSINKARQAEKVIEKAKEDLSPEEYKIAKDYVEQELARRKGLRAGKLESKP